MSDPIEETRAWIRDFVIRHNLCPFARFPFEQDRIRYVAFIDEHDHDQIDHFDALFECFLSELDHIQQADCEEVETTLLIAVDGVEDFEDYLFLLEEFKAAIEEVGLEGEIQLASFHPDYCFEDSQPDDPANLSNRSPYPMYHLIREDSVEQARNSYKDINDIPERNIAILRKLYSDK